MTYADSMAMLTRTPSNRTSGICRSTKREMPVHHFIVADNCSADGTIVKEFFDNRLLEQMHLLAM